MFDEINGRVQAVDNAREEDVRAERSNIRKERNAEKNQLVAEGRRKPARSKQSRGRGTSEATRPPSQRSESIFQPTHYGQTMPNLHVGESLGQFQTPDQRRQTTGRINTSANLHQLAQGMGNVYPTPASMPRNNLAVGGRGYNTQPVPSGPGFSMPTERQLYSQSQQQQARLQQQMHSFSPQQQTQRQHPQTPLNLTTNGSHFEMSPAQNTFSPSNQMNMHQTASNQTLQPQQSMSQNAWLNLQQQNQQQLFPQTGNLQTTQQGSFQDPFCGVDEDQTGLHGTTDPNFWNL